MRLLSSLSMALAFGLLLALPVMAQAPPATEDQRLLTSAAMDDASADHESTVNENRAELARILSLPQVHDLANNRGIEMERVEAAAAGLTDQQMEAVAPLLAKVSPMIQNSLGTVTVSVAAIIIILLILILVT